MTAPHRHLATERTSDLLVAYTMGSRLAVVGPVGWLLADVRPDPALVEACWSLARDGADLPRLVAVVQSAAERPAIAAAGRHGAMTTAFVQGDAWVELIMADGEALAVRPGPDGLFVDRPVAVARLGGPVRASADGIWLPLVGGTVLASGLTVHLAVDSPASQRPLATVPDRPPATVPDRPPATLGGDAWSEQDLVDGDHDRFRAMLGLTRPPAPPVEEFPETAPMRLRTEPEPIGLTTVRPAGPDSRNPDGFIDVDSLDWLAPGAAPGAAPSVSPIVRPPAAPASPWPANGSSGPNGASAPLAVPSPRIDEPTGQAVLPPDPSGSTDVPDELIVTTLRGAPGQGAAPGPLVGAVRCPGGHLNPPAAVDCRICAAPLPPQSPIQVYRPPLGLLRLSTGDSIVLDRNVVLGRAPGTPAGNGAGEPHYVKLAGRFNDVSRRHVEVRIDGWDVIAVDLESRNGTSVEQPGEAAVELPSGGSQALRNGAVVGLAQDVTFRFEATS